jgi:hypothetical protein
MKSGMVGLLASLVPWTIELLAYLDIFCLS